MPPLDPVTGAELAGGGVYLTRQVTKAIGRVIGPAVDEIAEALRAYTAFRLRNVQRIAERAEAKQLKTGRKGNVPPRLAHRILEEGSYCDDELMTEYLGGLLAGSRSPSGRDDRAATLCALVTSMSTLQVRAHYILYREWAFLLHGRTDVNIGVTAGRGQATLVAPTNVFASLLDPEGTLGRDVATHAITGLQRVGLLGDEWEMGNPDKMLKPPHPAPFRHLLRKDCPDSPQMSFPQGRSP